VIAHSPFRRLMSRLALAAAMLMAVAPTISRTVAAPEAAMPVEVAMQAAPMCVSGHLQDAVAVLPEAAVQPAHGEHPGMPGPHPDDPACGYCTLSPPGLVRADARRPAGARSRPRRILASTPSTPRHGATCAVSAGRPLLRSPEPQALIAPRGRLPRPCDLEPT